MSGDVDFSGDGQDVVAALASVSGDVGVADVGGDVHGSSVSGELTLELSGVTRLRGQSTSGDVTVKARLLDGARVTGPGKDRMVVFQETALMPWQTTYENIVFGPKLRGELEGQALEFEALRLIDKVGLSEFKDKFPLQLSGGMQRRAELARALINEPRIMIMDEPFRGLDAMSRELMQEFFLKIFEENRRTQIFVTSEIDEAIFLADRLVILSNKPAEVRTVIDIDLPRPRDFKMMSTPEAYRYKSEAMEILHEEAMKSFADTASASGFMEVYAKPGD